MNSWQDLLTYKPQAPTANENLRGWLMKTPQSVTQSQHLPGVEFQYNPRLEPGANTNNPPAPPTTSDMPPWAEPPPAANTNRNPWPFQRYGGPTASQQYEMPRLNPNVVATAAQIASQFLPPPARLALAAGTAIMAPTSTAPPSMDEAPPWSWSPNTWDGGR